MPNPTATITSMAVPLSGTTNPLVTRILSTPTDAVVPPLMENLTDIKTQRLHHCGTVRARRKDLQPGK
jgi:hypothetical protein